VDHAVGVLRIAELLEKPPLDVESQVDSQAVAGNLAATLVFLMIRSMPLWFAVMPGG